MDRATIVLVLLFVNVWLLGIRHAHTRRLNRDYCAARTAAELNVWLHLNDVPVWDRAYYKSKGLTMLESSGRTITRDGMTHWKPVYFGHVALCGAPLAPQEELLDASSLLEFCPPDSRRRRVTCMQCIMAPRIS